MLAFIDISGNVLSDPLDAWITVHAICIHTRSIHEITNQLFALKRDLAAKEHHEFKSTDLLSKSILNQPELENHKLIDSIVYRCLNHSDCYHASVTFKNSEVHKKKSEVLRLPRYYIDIMRRINALCEEKHQTNTIVITDSSELRADRNLAFAFNNFLYRTPEGQNMQANILPVPIFADSQPSAGLQLADLSAGIVRKYHTLNLKNTLARDDEDLYQQKIREYYAIVANKSVNHITRGRTIFGMYTASDGY